MAGRPSKPAKDRRTRRIILNLSENEYQALVRAARYEEDVMRYTRRVLLRHLKSKGVKR